MQLLEVATLANYLRSTGRLAADQPVQIDELSGGVSNVVWLVRDSSGLPLLVVKQAREQLRVPEPWFCSIERIWREIEVLEALQSILKTPAATAGPAPLLATVPELLFQDRENYLYAMSAAPAHEVWKSQLLREERHTAVAKACGTLLGRIHGGTWLDERVADRLGDGAFFDALRLDPYYRHLSRADPRLKAPVRELIDSLLEHPRCLVHGDFSPKNLLVHGEGLTLVDFEVGHFGDPAFDLGFFVTHLVLKAVRIVPRSDAMLELIDAFWSSYAAALRPVCGDAEFASLERRGMRQLAGCLLARVAGKSQVDYLSPAQRDWVREFATKQCFQPVEDWSVFRQAFRSAIAPLF